MTTVIQLVQFAIGIAHALQVYYVPGCRYPKAVANFELAEALYFFITFSNFYRRMYWKSPTSKNGLRQNGEIVKIGSNGSLKKLD